MLIYYPERRATAQQCLKDPWFSMPQEENFKMSEEEYEQYIKAQQKEEAKQKELDLSSNEAQDSDIYDGENEDNKSLELDEFDSELLSQKRLPESNKIIDRSFTNLGYIGYGDGILVEDLDQTANWQFDDFKEPK